MTEHATAQNAVSSQSREEHAQTVIAAALTDLGFTETSPEIAQAIVSKLLMGGVMVLPGDPGARPIREPYVADGNHSLTLDMQRGTLERYFNDHALAIIKETAAERSSTRMDTGCATVVLEKMLESQVLKLPDPDALRHQLISQAAGGLLGTDDQGSPVTVTELQPPHLLITGFIGSGKTELLKTLATNLALTGGSSVHIVQLDKGGAEYQGIAEHLSSQALPSTPVVGHDEDSATAILDAIKDALITRVENAQVAGEAISSAEPVYLLVDGLSWLSRQCLDRLCRLLHVGRASRIHVVIASQTEFNEIPLCMRADTTHLPLGKILDGDYGLSSRLSGTGWLEGFGTQKHICSFAEAYPGEYRQMLDCAKATS